MQNGDYTLIVSVFFMKTKLPANFRFLSGGFVVTA